MNGDKLDALCGAVSQFIAGGPGITVPQAFEIRTALRELKIAQDRADAGGHTLNRSPDDRLTRLIACGRAIAATASDEDRDIWLGLCNALEAKIATDTGAVLARVRVGAHSRIAELEQRT